MKKNSLKEDKNNKKYTENIHVLVRTPKRHTTSEFDIAV